MYVVTTVGPRRYIIEDEQGNLLADEVVELIKFIDAQKETKFMNPVHSEAWSAALRLSSS